METSVHLYDVTATRQCISVIAVVLVSLTLVLMLDKFSKGTSTIYVFDFQHATIISIQAQAAPYYSLVIAAIGWLGYEIETKMKLFIHASGAVSHGSQDRLSSIPSLTWHMRYG